ncbi:OprO/OprP family phosphate-selective porin [Novosphingobium lindaniclasticum]|uniref:Porin n=1 Tax=Novosphingobium lindaniclasticum LE124 TaxID=1096930 RepID=T0GUG2_9SPHN|nr:porin [Novosphingobium lindaniclasticum]EQB07616.1 hypothetical protein L284_22420 [Novosphingobium lindaniclasticum LE124]
MSQHSRRFSRSLALTSVLCLLAPIRAMAQAGDGSSLAELVRQQAQEIADLKQRLSALEAKEGVAGASPVAPAPVAKTEPPASLGHPEAPSRQVADAERVSTTSGPAEVHWGTAAAPVFSSPDGRFTFHPRGRVLLDASNTSGSNHPDRNYLATGARTLRLGADGTVARDFNYTFEVDFSQVNVNVLSAFIGWHSSPNRPVRYEIRAGNVFLDRGVEGGSSPDSVPLLERNTTGTTIAPRSGFYGLGLLGIVSGPNWHASLSATGDDLDGKTAVRDSWAEQGRVHWDPVHMRDGFVHLGAWGFTEKFALNVSDASRASPIGGRLNTVLRVTTAPIVGATGSAGYGGELGFGRRSAWFMAEGGRRRIHVADAADVTARAWSVTGGMFLTGEKPEYDSRYGIFVHPAVLRPIDGGGPGAVELVARYEELAYETVLPRDRGTAATLGVNWYPTSFLRFGANYIHWDLDHQADAGASGDSGDTLTARAQIVF